ncbi:MAG TPA: CocE/NonD family hydrolase [Nocardioidaceae bacterium]|nr:CocE/NonD family hydrolase [Nocardioidaceae bacterium]
MGERRDVWVTMSDGVDLAATLYLPDEGNRPQPCILEALPYRKDDMTLSYESEYLRLRDEHGYAVCRLDLRGTGSSGGLATDEYPAQEQQDLGAVISWLASQEWCDGAVGMYGTSYSGFNSLQMACERPPALRAVIAIYASDDRYTDDVHYRGGIAKMIDLVDYCHYMTPMCALPPVPAVWGEGWRDEWAHRVETVEPWLFRWLEEQVDGPYWRHGSVRPSYDRIGCPVMIVAGWADGYRNSSFRMLEALRTNGVPHRLLAGPWPHAATSSAAPGPRIDLMPEMVAWWDRWLRGDQNAVDDGGPGRPAVSAFVRTSTRPAPDLDLHEGFWTREEWPSPRITRQRLALDGRPPYLVRPDVGVDAWIDCAGHLPWGQSGDQRHDDAESLTWEWSAGGERVMGHPRASLRVSVDRPVAFCSVKLCDVFADGTSALVSRGSLNLTQRGSGSSPVALRPGEEYDVEVILDACAYAFAPGQRVRVSVAGADWPNTSAPPEPVTLTVHGGHLELPLWTGQSPYPPPVFLPGDVTSGEDAEGGGNPGSIVWRTERDVLRRTTECVVDHGSTYEVAHGGRAREHYQGRVGVDLRSFDQWATADVEFELSWPDATVSTRSTLDVRVDAEAYEVTIVLEAREGDRVVGERRWQRRFPRRLQ